MRLAHPAVELVARLERAWTSDAMVARTRAEIVVKVLLEAGLLSGAFAAEVESPPAE